MVSTKQKQQTTRILNENKRNLSIERNDDEEDQTLQSVSEYLSLTHPKHFSPFSNGFDQWMASYWRHLGKRELRTESGDGDWDFGQRIYPVHALKAVAKAWIQHKTGL
jgi:hypothetical protein